MRIIPAMMLSENIRCTFDAELGLASPSTEASP
jgi:hypothetical protein